MILSRVARVERGLLLVLEVVGCPGWGFRTPHHGVLAGGRKHCGHGVRDFFQPRKSTFAGGLSRSGNPGSDGLVVVIDPGDIYKITGLCGDQSTDVEISACGGNLDELHGLWAGFADCVGVWIEPDEFIDVVLVGELIVRVGRAEHGHTAGD